MSEELAAKVRELVTREGDEPIPVLSIVIARFQNCCGLEVA